MQYFFQKYRNCMRYSSGRLNATILHGGFSYGVIALFSDFQPNGSLEYYICNLMVRLIISNFKF